MEGGEDDLEDPYAVRTEDEEGNKAELLIKPRDNRPRNDVREWTHIGTFASVVLKDQKLQELASIECGVQAALHLRVRRANRCITRIYIEYNGSQCLGLESSMRHPVAAGTFSLHPPPWENVQQDVWNPQHMQNLSSQHSTAARRRPCRQGPQQGP